MSRRKEVICKCHGPIGLSPEYASPWEDVWIRLKDRRRHVVKLAPCLVSRSHVERDLEWDRKCQENPVRRPEGIRAQLGDNVCADDKPLDLSEDIAHGESVLARLAEETRFVAREYDLYERGIPNIYTTADRIDRAEAERMLDHYLAELGFTGPKKYRWKRPRFVVIPT